MCVAVLQASVREQKKLLVENAKLKKDIDQLRGQLQDKQKRRSGTETTNDSTTLTLTPKYHLNSARSDIYPTFL